ncbi:hypothetical protein ACIQTZ_11960 [Paenarthrobacter sp. NPDC090520]
MTLTVQDSLGAISRVSAEANTYDEAKATAEAKIPEGSKAIAVRTT